MIGSTKITLTSDSVREALEQYINRHLLESAQVKVSGWESQKIVDRYDLSAKPSVDVTCEPVSKDERPTPFPLSAEDRGADGQVG